MIDVVLLPPMLDPERLARSQVVVLDILRASTCIVTALAHGAKEVRLFKDILATNQAYVQLPKPVLRGGERQCLRIDGFELANSPGEYVTEKVGGATLCMTTTNGTAAVVAAQEAPLLFVGSLLNVSATVEVLLKEINTLDTLLLCAGTVGKIAQEDVIGAGAILWQLLQRTYRTDLPFTDTAWLAYHTFGHARQKLPAALRLGQGGLNLMNAGLEDDIDFCARLDSLPIAVKLEKNPLCARKIS